ncbi:MAG: hypothetical protein GBAus27B_000115 [Mycoplasmataceae bacterium]|nr:MAG: hypothetical protein GBAus27B_000115 [Mycoplasmataceae bacterium]
MYFGSNEKLKKKIQEFNEKSDWFIFNQGDLEPTYKDIKGRNYSIISSELRQKLGEIIMQRKIVEDNIFSSPIFIDCKLTPDPNETKKSFGSHNFGWWFVVRKEYIYQQARNDGGERLSLKLENKKGNWDNTCTSLLVYLFCDENHPEWKDICQNEQKLVKEKVEKFHNFCFSSWREIDKKIKDANIEVVEAFADGDYFPLQLEYCFCGGSPNGHSEYYRDHILNCLSREERVEEFKNEIIKILEKNIERFNRRRKEVINNAKQKIREKGLNISFDFWEQAVQSCWNSEQLTSCENQINNLVREIFNVNENLRSELERLAREKAESEREKAESERKDREFEKEQKRLKEEMKKAGESSKNQQAEEQKAEEKFKSNNKNFRISPEGKRLEKELADLQKKISELEKSGDNSGNSFYKDKKRELERQLLNLQAAIRKQISLQPFW